MPIRKMCRSTGVSYSSAHFTNWHIIYLDRTSFLIRDIRQSKTYNCRSNQSGQLRPNDQKALAKRQRAWNRAMHLLHRQRPQTPHGRHQQCHRRFIKQLTRCKTQQIQHKPLVSDHLIVRSPSRRTQCLSDKVDNHIIEHAEKQPDRHTSQCRSRRLFKTD